MSSKNQISGVKRDFIEGSGRSFQSVGLPRTTGQVFGFIYLSNVGLALDDIVAGLKVSKGSASIATRQLMQIGAIRQTWVRGDRRPHFEAVEDLTGALKQILKRFVVEPLAGVGRSLERMVSAIGDGNFDAKSSEEEKKCLRDRLQSLLKLEKQVKKSLNLLEAGLHEI
jgi:DNA-binding transcriptional regulator GbsR (MarR family)